MEPSVFRHIVCYREGSVLVVELADKEIQGDDLAEAIRQELFAALDKNPSRKIAVDFRKVASFSSVGFRPLLSLHRRLQAGNGRMIFFHLSPLLVEIFKVTRLISTSRSSSAPFELAMNLDDALGRLRGHICRVDDGILIVTLAEPNLQGDLMADELSEELLLTAKYYNATRIVVDFHTVDMLTTPCLRPLLHLRSHIEGKNGRIVLCNMSPLISQVMTVTRLISSTQSQQMPFAAAADIPAALALLRE